MSIGLIFLELSIAALLIGGISVYKRSMGERVVMLAVVNRIDQLGDRIGLIALRGVV